jgi:hypothetical protein
LSSSAKLKLPPRSADQEYSNSSVQLMDKSLVRLNNRA